MRFSKMNGLGNDYIYINLFDEEVKNPGELAIRLSDRHFGIGSDGLILIGESNIADFSMRMFNPDGSEGEMCGNAIRCVGKYVFDKGLTNKKNLSISTLAGVKLLKLSVINGKVDTVCVDMGEPGLDPEKIGISATEPLINKEVNFFGKKVKISCVSMGNPHCVLFSEDVTDADMDFLGRISTHPIFKNRVNVEIVSVINRKCFRMRVYERGTGETLACGTGACAAFYAAYINGLIDNEAEAKLKGGSLKIAYKDNKIFMIGKADLNYEGEIFL